MTKENIFRNCRYKNYHVLPSLLRQITLLFWYTKQTAEDWLWFVWWWLYTLQTKRSIVLLDFVIEGKSKWRCVVEKINKNTALIKQKAITINVLDIEKNTK